MNNLKPQSGLEIIQSHCFASRSQPLLQFGFAALAEIVAMAGRLGKAVSAIAPSLSIARPLRSPRERTPLALQVEGESGIAYRRCLFYPLPTRGSAVSALRLGSVPHAAPPHAALPPLAAPRPSAPKGGALITTEHKLCADIRR